MKKKIVKKLFYFTNDDKECFGRVLQVHKVGGLSKYSVYACEGSTEKGELTSIEVVGGVDYRIANRAFKDIHEVQKINDKFYSQFSTFYTGRFVVGSSKVKDLFDEEFFPEKAVDSNESLKSGVTLANEALYGVCIDDQFHSGLDLDEVYMLVDLKDGFYAASNSQGQWFKVPYGIFELDCEEVV